MNAGPGVPAPLAVALYRPEIPPNTGNIARLCVCAGVPLHIVGRPSFRMDERAVRRAGLDYWSELELHRHSDWGAFKAAMDERPGAPARILAITKRGTRRYSEHPFAPGDVLFLGRETDGLPPEIMEEFRTLHPERMLAIPMMPGARSLNLANAASIVLYKGLRRLGFPGM